MSGKKKRLLIAAAAAVVIITALIAGRGWIASRTYFRTADRLADNLPLDLKTKYGEELKYTVDKFWSCYSEGICSRNDMTDVMDRMRQLASSREVTDSEIFDFIGFVSRLYTDRLDDRHRESIRRMEEERDGEG
jgi:hypothetical protein